MLTIRRINQSCRLCNEKQREPKVYAIRDDNQRLHEESKYTTVNLCTRHIDRICVEFKKVQEREKRAKKY